MPIQVGVDTCNEFMLLSAFVGWCFDCKGMHGVSDIKSVCKSEV